MLFVLCDIVNKKHVMMDAVHAVHQNIVMMESSRNSSMPQNHLDQVDLICRFCLSELRNGEVQALFDAGMSETVCLADKTMNFVNIKVLPNDGLPSKACKDCCQKIDSSFKFKIQVEQADCILREKFHSFKEDLYFADVNPMHKNDGVTITADSIFLKDNIVEQIVQQDKKSDFLNEYAESKQHNLAVHDDRPRNQNMLDVNPLDDIDAESHNQSFGAQDLQEIMLNDINEHEKMQGITHKPENLNDHFVKLQKLDGVHEILQNQVVNQNQENVREEKTLIPDQQNINLINEDKILENNHTDEENYFENLSLSYRLKLIKVFFICHICDEQFSSKDILKKHMSSHKEIKDTITYKSPVKNPSTGSTLTKTSSNNKGLNVCPHCGKEYLYTNSFTKHLREHLKEQNNYCLPLEVSLQENNNSSDDQFYDESSFPNYNEVENVNKCSVCNEHFQSFNELKDHRSKHVLDGVFAEQDFKDIKPEISNDECDEFKIEKDACKYSGQSENINQENEVKSFRCTECDVSYENELMLRNHVIATSHKTMLNGQEYDPNKRIKRVAAKAAQKIIDQIKIHLVNEDDEEMERPDKKVETIFVKEENQQSEDEWSPEMLNLPPNINLTLKVHVCETCDQTFPSKRLLAKHMDFHERKVDSEKEKNLQDKGKKKVKKSNNDSDDDNFEAEWPMSTHVCTTCKKSYTTKKSLLRHQLLHQEPNFECDICKVKFYRKDKLKAHYDKCSEKNPDRVRLCNICGDSFDNNELLKEHKAKHVTEGLLSEEDLKDIENVTKENDERKLPKKRRRLDIVGLQCTTCNKKYSSRKGLLRHLQTHEDKSYLCDMCPKKFYRREHLKVHVAKHNIVKPYKCPRCPKRFIKQDHLDNHIPKHDRRVKKQRDGDSLKRYLCEICSKSFTQHTTLVAHLRAHKGIKPYICEVCSRPFTTNAYLKMHMRTHTQERPYICQFCSRAFARADTLANHLTSHTGEAKYHCVYCPKHFRRLKSLKEHVFIHTGQKPYACPTCDRKFNNNGSRYAHSKRCKMLHQTTISGDAHSKSELQTMEQQDQIEEILEAHQEQREMIVVKPNEVITICKPDGSVTQQQVVSQDLLMPLMLPLTMSLADVADDSIMPEAAKMFPA